jgi:hypothetical protein
MRTFLQHINVQPKGETVTCIIPLDESREISVSYQPPIIRPPKARDDPDEEASESGKLLKPWNDIHGIFDAAGNVKQQAELSSWAFPGIGGRYGEEKKGKAWKGPASHAFLLMIAPIACLYLRLPRTEAKIKEKRVWVENWVVVVPDIRDLEDFGITRRRMMLNTEFMDAASLGDAGLQFFTEYSTRNPRKTLGTGCRVIADG